MRGIFAVSRSLSATPSVIVCSVLRPRTSVTRKVSGKLPAVAGTPLISAVEPLPWSPMKPTCVGSEPWVSSQRYGALPPVALSSIVSGTVTSATWVVGAVIESAGAGAGVGVGAGAGAGAGLGVGPGPLPPESLIVIVNSRCASDGTHQLSEGGF